MGDVPYAPNEDHILKQIENLPSDGRFLIHLGDIKMVLRLVMKKSTLSKFDVVEVEDIDIHYLVDNEWNDCMMPKLLEHG